MDREPLSVTALLPAIAGIAAACLFYSPASAGDNVQVVPLYSDGRGNQAWVEIEPAGDRKKATPVVAVGDEGFRRALEDPDEKGRLSVPFPRLMRLVDRVREAIRGMKRPVRNAPPGPAVVTAPAAEPAGRAGEFPWMSSVGAASPAPAERADPDLAPPAPVYNTATR